MDSIVVIDIETTGLDTEKDSIIEIGAVRFNNRRVEGEWTTLINPGRRIPPEITRLTGITDQMVLQAPPIRDVVEDLAHFVGNAPVLGHRIEFDLAFLRRYGILLTNESLDTYEMAGVLLPGAERYNLSALAQSLNVLFPATHRGLDDARATRGVFLRLFEEALNLPISLLAEIVRLSEPINWGGYWPFKQALRQRSHEIVNAQSVRHTYLGPIFDENHARPGAPLQQLEDIRPLDIDETAAILEPGGSFSRFFPDFEYRAQQVEMLRAVSDAFSQGKHLLVEAGTGTGKSMAYLIPAALWALHNNCRVIISTNTINLQDQLINKDIPDLRAALGIDLKASVIKGRSNYICPRRLENLRRKGPDTADEMRVLGKTLVWLQTTKTGDRGEINLNGPIERQVWQRISAEDEGCSTENCLKRTGGICPFYRIRQAAVSSHLLIINHALLLADVATGNRVLPEYNYLIVDEAHHLEEATTNALGFDVTLTDMIRLLRELGGENSGVLGWLLRATPGILSPGDYASLNYLVHKTTDLAFRLENQLRQFFAAVDHFLNEQREGRPMGMYSQQERILAATRTQPSWGEVEFAWDQAQSTFKSLLENLAPISKSIGEIGGEFAEEDAELLSSLGTVLRRLSECNENINAFVFSPATDQVYWAETPADRTRISLHSAPIHIGALMDRYLWSEKSSVILTSATLTTAGEFDYIRGRLNAQDCYELSLGSPFDYETSALLYLVNDIPEPFEKNAYQRSVEQGLINLCRSTGGKTLVLFTSYDQLKRTSQAISPVLAKQNIVVYEQGDGASPHSLLETFRTTDRAVLLGTKAFWEGVDVPGQALSVLVIAKLPFDVPSDPIIAARAETFDDSFYQYSLPEAILRFRQGFGRLVRTQFDRGVVVIFDRRIISKRYGQMFVDSLPSCTVQTGGLADLPRAATRWLNI